MSPEPSRHVVVSLSDVRWRPDAGNFTLGPIDVSAQRGHFIAVVGPNGAGKSSLLRLLTGFLRPKSGSIQLNGRPLQDCRARERARFMAYLSQEPERSFGFSVEHFVTLGRFAHMGPFRSPSADDRRLIDQVVDVCKIRGQLRQSIQSLSGGEFQRVRLARALCQSPCLLLVDEPGNHLDLPSRVGILQRLKKEALRGLCVIGVIHDINDALLYADQVWIMKSGRIVLVGTPEQVLNSRNIKSIFDIELTCFTSRDGRTIFGPSSNT